MMLGLANIVLLEEGTPTMASLIADLSTGVTAIFGWIGTIATTITTTPILLLTTSFLVLGGAVGIFGRLLSKN